MQRVEISLIGVFRIEFSGSSGKGSHPDEGDAQVLSGVSPGKIPEDILIVVPDDAQDDV